MTKKVLYILILLLLVWFGGFLGFNRAINDFNSVADVETDAIVVLTGGRNRLKEAVHLLNDGKAEKLFVSGVYKGTSVDELEKRNDVTINSNCEIVLDEKAQNTVENAKEVLTWVSENKIESIRLVTSNYHLPRSMEEFRANDCDLEIIPHPVFSEKILPEWWKSWNSFRFIAMEYNKFLYTWVKYNLWSKKEG